MKVLLWALFALGCTRPSDLRPEHIAPSDGESLLLAAPIAAVIEAARAVASDLELEVEDAGVDWFVAARSMTGFSWGEVVGVYARAEAMGTRVQVVSKRVLATNITAEDFTQPMLRGIRARTPIGPVINPWTREAQDPGGW